MRRIRFSERGGPESSRLAALEDFAKSLNTSPLLEQILVAGTLRAGSTDALVSHPLGRAPLVTLVGSASRPVALVPMDARATRELGGDPSREVRVHLDTAETVDVTFVLLVG